MKKLSQDKKIFLSQQIELIQHYIILLEYPVGAPYSKSEIEANIYCLDKDSNIIWQVNAEKGKIGSIYDEDPFVHIQLDNDAKIRANRFSGNEYLIDVLTGKGEQVGWIK